jgi:hypothetical protein
MKKIILHLLFISFMLYGTLVKANDAEGSGHDVGFSIGPNFALTDLGGAKKIGAPFIRDVDFKATRYCISAFYRYNVNKFFAVRANLMYGMLKADDNNTDGTPPPSIADPLSKDSDSWYRARRNLNFETHMFEFQALAEINLKKYLHDEARGSKERWAPYIAGGLGFFYFNPYTRLNGDKVKLKPLGTEGQNIGYKKPYSNFQFDLMALVGIKYNVTERISIALEGVYHQTFTDYLDDVSGSYINPQDISRLSSTAQILQNRSNTGRYPLNEWNYVEGQFLTNTTAPPNRDLNTAANALGQQRGDKKDNDQFFHVQLTFSFSLGASGKKLGFGSCGKRNPYHMRFSCPKW